VADLELRVVDGALVDVPRRAELLGRILGRFARESGALYVVSFEGDRVRVAGDVLFEEIVLADDLRASA